MPTHTDMNLLTEGMSTKSAKIRALGRAGFKRQEIADFLNIRYQHVRNVLVDEERRGTAVMGPVPHNWPRDLETKSAETLAEGGAKTMKVKLGPDGQLSLPGSMLEALGWAAGETIWVNLEEGGEIRLSDVGAVVRRVQDYARANLPNTGSVDDFLAWRREEAARETREIDGAQDGAAHG